ncbi:hypothetical protein [Oryzobacter sp. 24SJ04S-52]|uniref:hypothetical protein n=1 Tax=Oryzobacter telluris TaxID=3149179 RepID=UPI00370D6EB0
MPEVPAVRTGYTSTPAIAEREARAIVRRQMTRPRYVVRAAAVELATTAVGVGLGLLTLWAFDVSLPAWWVCLLVVVPAALLGALLDLRRNRRRLRRAATEHALRLCPVGTRVKAVWHRDRAEVTTATLTDVIRFDEVTHAVWDEEEGVLFLERERTGAYWAVPSELVSSEALGLLEAALGPRWSL